MLVKTSHELHPQKTAHSTTVLDGPRYQTTSGYMTALIIFIFPMPYLAATIDDADLLFALVITPAFLSTPRRGGGSRPS